MCQIKRERKGTERGGPWDSEAQRKEKNGGSQRTVLSLAFASSLRCPNLFISPENDREDEAEDTNPGNEVFVDEFSFPGLVVFCLLSRLLELKDMKRLMVYERKRKG